jgi:hypothetical protein
MEYTFLEDKLFKKNYLNDLIRKYYTPQQEENISDQISALKEWIIEFSGEFFAKFFLSFSQIIRTPDNKKILICYQKFDLSSCEIAIPDVIEFDLKLTSGIVLEVIETIIQSKIDLYFYDRNSDSVKPYQFNGNFVLEKMNYSVISLHFVIQAEN